MEPVAVESLVKAVVVQAARDVKRGYKTKSAHSRIVEETFFNYHTAKAWLAKDIELLIFAFGVSHKEAQMFLETN